MRAESSNFRAPSGILICEMAVAIPDADLVHAAQAGDPAALGALLERHRPALYATALSILREREAAQDAVQETLIVALRRIGELREPTAVAGWLHAIARNASLMQLRRRRRELPADDAPQAVAAAGPEIELERLALRDWVWSALEGLPDDQRVAVMLRHFARTSSYEEIAATLGVPVGTVRSRLHQARAKLADALLRTAAQAHADHAQLAARRRREWEDAIGAINATGRADGYAAGCADDVLVRAPALGYRRRGIADHRRDVESSAAAGVRMRVTDVIASPRVTIVEGALINPPTDPHHCPPTQTEVRIHTGGRTERLFLYYPPRRAG